MPLLEEDEEDVSYDAKSLFTNIPAKETICYIIDQIYVQKTLTTICMKLTSKRLLFRLAIECKFIFPNSFYQQAGDMLMIYLTDENLTRMKFYLSN